MIKIILLALMALLLPTLAQAQSTAEHPIKKQNNCQDFTNVTLRKLRSKEFVNLCQFENQPLLIVNTASNCGFTPQFAGLEAVYNKYKDQGLVVLGFPSDDFFQEENNEQDTAKVCFVNYGVTFTMFATSAVRGSDANPIFKHLNSQTSSPNWNFYKYLVSADRKTITRFNSKVAPESEKLTAAIEATLAIN
ncbi:glutathione peroxidase [Pseudoalteromonas nigrifaciens]|uniref:Glutathione peroxidase n=2 Tax=Pseudoalteromonas TaxID=53246 RepID=Q3IFX1_PSET1|nr:MULTISPECIES: glutathione peroxidase [Pseudoalteromonas]ASM55102.1 glutathione peroxidase [Pseudoalteromonas nigrifaciens]MBB1369267.1 glutathione peroxidase [Pseudoalteromonas sp. SR45-4]PCC13621.1 glutathione peroxidase [Pseudoalteromonas sp. JB197]CAI87535.1 glutathione peroxidase precursor [Pseudoalteromonas translucida]SJN18426.1 Glutathione peroxidase family protein [Pseudoalteromonas sp. JB197]